MRKQRSIDAALRKENSRLHAKIASLEAELISAKHRIAALQSVRGVIRTEVDYDELKKEFEAAKNPAPQKSKIYRR